MKNGKKVKGIPAAELIWVTQTTISGATYYVTSKASRDVYFVYQDVNGEAVKLGKGKNPAKLLDQYAK